MKRIITLLLAVTMVLGAVGAAQAIDIKVKGTWDFSFMWTDGTTDGGYARSSKRGEREDDSFNAVQRVRTQINFIASENLQGVLMFEIGNTPWGGHSKGSVGRSSGGALDADGVNIETKRAFLDWMVPGSNLAIRMGIQALNLPMANGYTNPVFSADVAAVVANYQFNDMFGLTAFWARPFDNTWTDSNKIDRYDEADMFGILLPITGDGWSVTPWGVYANVGNASGLFEYVSGYDRNDPSGAGPLNTVADRTNAWWAGVSSEVSLFDPLTFGFDVMYGRMSEVDLTRTGSFETKGWFVAAALNYDMGWGVPGLFGWWSTGDDYDDIRDGEYGRIPVVGIDDGFGPTSFGTPGGAGPIGDTAVTTTATGTWGLGVQIADMSFIEDLTHTLRFAYYRGTNDHEILKNSLRGGFEPLHISGEAVYLTDKDNVYEINFDHKYQIYENLAAYLELGYLHLDLKEFSGVRNEDRDGGNAWKANLLFKYDF